MGSDLTFRVLTERWKDVGQIRSDRGCLAGRQLTAVVIDNSTEEILERTSFTPPAANRGFSSWPKLFADHINKELKLARAGKFDTTDPGTTWSTYSNRLWTALPGTRVFTTGLHADAWESVATINGGALTLTSVVTVQACSALTGKVHETLNFTPGSERLDAALWGQDLARYINANSLLLRAGRPWKKGEYPSATLEAADNDTDICYPTPSRGLNLVWVPKGSGLAVNLSIGEWEKSTLGIDSDRAAMEGRPITAVVIDSVSEEILETTVFIPQKDRRGSVTWPKDCANHINQHSRWMRVGECDEKGFSGKESTWDNYLWTPPGIRGFIAGCWNAAYWENIGSLNGGALGTQAVVSVRVCSRVTGKVYETLNFSPAKDRLRPDQWGQDLARHINQHSVFLRAGREWRADELDAAAMKSEGQELFYPTGSSSGSNILWAPKGSLLSVEISGDCLQVPGAAPAIPYRVEVDNFSGVYSCKVPLATVVGNNGAGPEFKLEFDVSRSRAELNVSSIFEVIDVEGGKTIGRTLRLRTANGIYHSIELTDSDDVSLVLGDVNLSLSPGRWVLEYAGGGVEYFTGVRHFQYGEMDDYHREGFYLPKRIENCAGLGLSLSWEDSKYMKFHIAVLSKENVPIVAPVVAVLKSVIDDCGQTLVRGEYTKTSYGLIVFPDRSDLKMRCDLSFSDYDFDKNFLENVFGKVSQPFSSARPEKITFTYANAEKADLKFSFNDSDLKSITSSASDMLDELTSDKLGRVTKHVRRNASDTVSSCSYAYNEKDRSTVLTKESADIKATEEYHYEATVNRLKKHVMKSAGCELSKEYTYTSDTKAKTHKVEMKVTHAKDKKTRTETTALTLDEHGNVIKREEDGFITEWTYYRGDPEVKGKEISSSRVEKQTSGIGLVFGWAIDYINPVGWCNSIFNDKGLTWGTDYEREKYFSARATKHEKKVFGLPLELNYPGNLQFFTRDVESERLYTMSGDKRVDLKWTFYSYTTLKHFKGDARLLGMVVDKKVIIHNPVSADNKKIDSHAGGERHSYTYHANTSAVGCYGEIATSEIILIGKDGKDIADSKRKESYNTLAATTDHSTHIHYDEVTQESVTSAGLTSWLFKDLMTGNVRREMHGGAGQDKYMDYDAHGRLKTLKFLKESHSDVLQTYTHGYYRHGDLRQEVVTSDAGNSVRNVLDLSGRLVQHQRLISAATGWRTLQAYRYDGLGRETECIEYDHGADGRFLSRSVTSIAYDHWGRANRVSTDGQCQCSDYDPVALTLTEWSEGLDKKVHGGKTVTHFNANQTPASVQIQDDNGKELGKQSFTYTRKTEISKITSTRGDTAFEYDAFGRTVLVQQQDVKFHSTYPAHTRAPVAAKASMQWNKDSAEQSLELGTQTVDVFGRVTGLQRGGFKQSYSYSVAGRLGQPGVIAGDLATHRPKEEALLLDECTFGVCESFTGQVAQTALDTSSHYSLQRRLLRVVDAFGQHTHYHYTREGIYRAQANHEMSSQVRRGSNGRVEEECSRVAGSGHVVRTTFTYDGRGRESQRRIEVSGFEELSLQRTYDENGRLKRALTCQGSKNTVIRDENYTYSTSGSLLRYTCAGSHKPLTFDFEQEQIDFEHDPAGGVSKSTLKVTREAYGTHNVINACTYGGTGISAETLSELSVKREGRKTGRVITCGSDTSGRLETLKYMYEGSTTNGEYKLAYNVNGRLHQIQDVKNDYTTAYTYDMAGKLVGRKDSLRTVDLLYRNNLPYAQIRHTHASDTVQRMVLVNQSDACELQRIDTTRAGKAGDSAYTLEIKDAHGSIIASYDLSGNSTRFLSYTPYGERPTSHDDLSWRGFNGEVLDPEMLGIYHLGQGYRVYSPWMMRFITGDSESPFGVGGANAYAYCYGDPVNYCDPSGHQVIGRYTHSERAYFSDPLVEAIVTGVIGLALGGAGGLAAFGVMGAVVAGGLSAASTGLGVGALYVGKSNPDLAGMMQMFAFALDFDGTFGSVASRPGLRGAGIRPRSSLELPASGNLARTSNRPDGVRSYVLKSDGGADLFVLHTHPKNKHLLIDAHGSSIHGFHYANGNVPPRVFSTDVTPEIGFYADHGFTTTFPKNKGYLDVLNGKAAPSNFYQGTYPNYILSELSTEFVARERGLNLKNAKLLKKDLFDLVQKGWTGMDYLTPLSPVALDRVFAILKREGFSYQMVSGLHCRGRLMHDRWHAAARKAIRQRLYQLERDYGLNPIKLD
ncbi:RHS repeat-associated core domain-containing protein [Pseudomonas japonica]|uniref:RHS repeat-associated core domain-containing protein n=1 Tax=Pseudomonas japonica TaxID=256466 RepID=UPI001FDF267D|nr:RHS repeat-associated core domain-containing protein [Pseudomonas japonica]